MNRQTPAQVMVMQGGIITLTTDFGLADEYVGVMKGVILSRAPQARLVDLSHEVRPQDVRQAGMIVNAGRAYFPAGTIHVAVVDPGVGGDRKIVLLLAFGQLFLAPDNGLLTPLLDRDNFQGAHAVSREHLFLKPVSSTFHGRDIMAPVAAHLAAGLSPHEVGPELPREELTTLKPPPVTFDPERRTITGAVVRIDRFGNLITNISRDCLTPPGQPETAAVEVTVGDFRLQGIQSFYAGVAKGAPLALFGSQGFLEIAVNQGNAARELHAGLNDKIIIAL